MLGDFLEISVHSENVLESVQFYERFGFTQIVGNDTWKHPYGVVTDGRCFIGIHAFRFPGPALTFVAPALRRRVEELEAAGAEFEFLKLGDDEFHELGFFLPDEQMITLLEARTFSPPPAGIPPSLAGFFAEYRIPVEDEQAAAERWLRFGLLENEPVDDLHGGMSLCWTGLNVGLSESRRLRQPALVFHVPHLGERVDLLEQRGILPAQAPAASATSAARYLSPEGTQLLILESPA